MFFFSMQKEDDLQLLQDRFEKLRNEYSQLETEMALLKKQHDKVRMLTLY